MKKLLFTLLTGCLGWGVSAQVICYVETPASLEGNLDFTWAEPSGGWGTADLNDPLEAITGTLVFVDDGSAGDSLGCNALVNGSSIAGNIAVLYRGTCEFGLKALNAENAGAIGVIIINNVGGSPIALGAGANGASVTIPVAMITDVDGAALKSEIDAGNVTVFLGSKTGFYADDLGFYAKDVMLAERFANPSSLSQNASEFSFTPGGWVFNFGTNPQASASLTATIEHGGSTIYNQSAIASVILNTGDSVYIALPTFSQSSYADGYYTVTYTLGGASAEEFPQDNQLSADFAISPMAYGLCPLDETTMEPVPTSSFRPNGATSWQACVHFMDPNASRMVVEGLWVTNAAGGTNELTGMYFETVAYEWQDIFVDLDDPNFAVNGLVDLEYGDYTYNSDLENIPVYVPFASTITLQDNIRYLFCITPADANMYVGFNTAVDYDEVVNDQRQPMSPIFSDGSFYALGFGTDAIPTITVRMLDATQVGVKEDTKNTIAPYPNPATTTIQIPLDGISGADRLEVYDLTGKLVMKESVSMNGSMLTVSVDKLASGQYSFRLTREDTLISQFKVVVAK
jgi:hypothetical protein